MALMVELLVAMHQEGPGYKHWGLLVDGPGEDDHTVLHVKGSSQRFYFEMKDSNPRDSAHLSELISLCKVPARKLDEIKEMARNAPIHNEYPGYNCQDYVLELLDALEEMNIINQRDDEYMKNKEKVSSKQEGLI